MSLLLERGGLFRECVRNTADVPKIYANGTHENN